MVCDVMRSQNLVKKGEKQLEEGLFYSEILTNRGVVNLWLEQWSWKMMTNPGRVVVNGKIWKNGTNEIGLPCGSEPDGTFHGECGPKLGGTS